MFSSITKFFKQEDVPAPQPVQLSTEDILKQINDLSTAEKERIRLTLNREKEEIEKEEEERESMEVVESRTVSPIPSQEVVAIDTSVAIQESTAVNYEYKEEPYKKRTD